MCHVLVKKIVSKVDSFRNGGFCMFGEFLSFLIDETCDLVSGIHEDAKQLNDELLHINDNTYVSPYQKRNDAREKIDRAENKIFKANDRFERHYDIVKEKIRKNYELKKLLLNRLDSSTVTIKPTLTGINAMEGLGFRQRDDFEIGEMLGLWGHEMMDQAASQYLEDAKDFEVEARAVVARIEQNGAKLKKLEYKIDLEGELLNVLSENYYSKSLAKKNQMASVIKNLMNIQICDRQGNIQEKYVSELEKLRTI